MSFEQLHPGDSIRLTDATELVAFEDTVAYNMDPTMTSLMQEAWVGRTTLKDLIRPPKFNGTIADIELVVMDLPFERLVDARERGWKFRQISGFLSSMPKDEEVINSFRGFTFLAEARSSGKGTIGQIQAELWFNRVGANRNMVRDVVEGGSLGGGRKRTNGYGGASVLRRVTVPKIETTKFVELHETSRRIGLEVLRNAMRHPTVLPMHQ
jgi:hypothetical protein